jgi:hypothetical protein
VRTLARFVLALSAVVLLGGLGFGSPPRHPGVASVNNPYAACGGKSTSFANRVYQGAKKFLGMDKSEPPMSSFGQEPGNIAFDIDNAKVVDGLQNSQGYKDFKQAREEDYPEPEYKFDLDKDVLSEENWPYDQLNPRTPEEIVNMAKSRAMNALEDRIGMRYKAILEQRKLTQDECLKDKRLSDIIRINAGHMINAGRLPDIKSLTDDPKWKKLTDEFAKKDSIVNAIDSKKSSDSGYCKCAVPSDRDFYCTKCGKMSSWLAPREDPEFLHSLMKRAK